MNIIIRIIYQGSAAKLMQRGSFPVNTKRFKENADQEAARVAFEWLKQIKREMHVNGIVEVVYDGEKNITELVKKLDKYMIDTLPFKSPFN